MIFRKRLKKEIKCDEIEELYLATIQETNDTDSISASTVQRLDEIPNWIRKDYETRIIPADTSYTINRPPDSTETGYATTIQRNISIISVQTTRIKTIIGSTVKGR
jgi:hypothetical protein